MVGVAQPIALAVRLAALAAGVVADHFPIDVDDQTGTTLRQAHGGLQMGDGVTLGDGPWHDPASGIWTELAIAYEVVALQLYSIASEIQCLRATSPAFAPARARAKPR